MVRAHTLVKPPPSPVATLPSARKNTYCALASAESHWLLPLIGGAGGRCFRVQTHRAAPRTTHTSPGAPKGPLAAPCAGARISIPRAHRTRGKQRPSAQPRSPGPIPGFRPVLGTFTFPRLRRMPKYIPSHSYFFERHAPLKSPKYIPSHSYFFERHAPLKSPKDIPSRSYFFERHAPLKSPKDIPPRSLAPGPPDGKNPEANEKQLKRDGRTDTLLDVRAENQRSPEYIHGWVHFSIFVYIT